MKIKSIEEFLEEKTDLNESDLLKEYKKMITDVRKLLVQISTKPNSGDLYNKFKEAGFEFDDSGLKIKGESLSKIIGDTNKFLQQLNNSVASIR